MHTPGTHLRRSLAALSTGVLLTALLSAVFPSNAVAGPTICPPDGATDTTFHGGLVVTDGNFCSLSNVTVYGPVTVRAGGVIDLEDSRVNGGVIVQPGGEIEIGISLFGGTETHSIVTGGLRLHDPIDWDIETATIFGGVRIVGGVEFNPTFCGNTIWGKVSIKDVATDETWIGDPEPEEGLINGLPCEGNRIHGSLSLSDSSGFEVEGNVVQGSVLLKASSLELNGNTIGGSLICSKGTVILPPAGPDPSGNSVRGKNTC